MSKSTRKARARASRSSPARSAPPTRSGVIEALAETGLHAHPGLLVCQPAHRAGLGRRRGCGRRFHAEGRGRLHGAVVQRQRAQPGAGVPQQAVDHRLDLAVRVGCLHAENLHRSHADNVEAMRKQTALHLENNVPVPRIGVMAAFGCNYQGDIAPAQVVRTLEDGLDIAEEAGAEIDYFSLADTMGWATPLRIERVIGEVRSRWPDMQIALHLHDTRGLAVANAHAGAQARA